MGSLRRRLIIGITCVLVVVASVLPVGAQDDSGTANPTPVNKNGVVTIGISVGSSIATSLSLPIRCGNNC